MPEIGFFLSSEEHGPRDLTQYAQLAERAGFHKLWLSDHFHPWTERQGQSPFVWSVIGAIGATTGLHVTTAVTCPTVRIHPAIVAQAAATSALLLQGRFSLGVGSGENLNEHVLGDPWPRVDVRLEMLEEAVEVIRELWTGKLVSHDGDFYEVSNARLYSLPDAPPDVIVSGFGPKATELAARIGDGYANVAPDAEAIETYRKAGGTGVKQGGLKVCWGLDEAAARKLAHETWPNEGLTGQLAQELPQPLHFEQAGELVTEDMIAEKITCGPDPDKHAAAIRAYLDAGYDEVYVSQIGKDQEGFLRFFEREVRPRL